MKGWQKYFGLKPKFEEQDPQDNSPADDDKLQALASAVNELEARVGAIETQLNSVQDDVDTITEVVDTEEFAVIRDNAKRLLPALMIWVIKAVSVNSAVPSNPANLISFN